jgi:hypothetical protein
MVDHSPNPRLQRLRSASLANAPSPPPTMPNLTIDDTNGWAPPVKRALANRYRARPAAFTQSALRAGSLSYSLVGVVQKESGVLHVIAEELVDHSELLGRLVTHSRDFH